MSETTAGFLDRTLPLSLHEQPCLQEVRVREGAVLRPMEDADAPDMLAALAADPSIRERVTVAARITTEEDVSQEVARYRRDPSTIRYSLFRDGKYAGLVSLWYYDGFFGGDVDEETYGFGYFLDPSARGEGLVQDSVKALMLVAEDNLPVKRFVAYCEDNNEASVKVLRSLGLQPTEQTYTEPTNGWTERLYEKRVVR